MAAWFRTLGSNEIPAPIAAISNTRSCAIAGLDPRTWRSDGPWASRRVPTEGDRLSRPHIADEQMLTAESPSEFAQPGVVDSEVMTHLVNDRPPNLLDDLGLAVAHTPDGTPVDRDPVWRTTSAAPRSWSSAGLPFSTPR